MSILTIKQTGIILRTFIRDIRGYKIRDIRDPTAKGRLTFYTPYTTIGRYN